MMHGEKAIPFGTRSSRFSLSYDLKMLYDRSPVPGTYNVAREK